MKKALAILRWILIELVSLLGWITAKFMFPLAYVLRNVKLFRNYILWIYYDDEDGIYGAYWWNKRLLTDFWTAYRWNALRNPAWNLQAILKPKECVKKPISIYGRLRRNGADVGYWNMAVLKYVDANGRETNNKGQYISLQHSIIGRMLVWYYNDNTLHFRYSFAKNVWKRFWIEIHLGTTEKRYTFRFKIKNKHVYEN